MDIAIDTEGSTVIQYVNLADFAQILAPLDTLTEPTKAKSSPQPREEITPVLPR